MMQADVKQRWIEALESGKYEQARGCWGGKAYGDYCCLQVLREEVLKEPATVGYVEHDGYEKRVQAAGLPKNQMRTLMYLNDIDQRSFAEIAAWVRDYVEAA